MATVNPEILKEIKKYSVKNINTNACFNCGNCTAICNLSTDEYQFPRSLIRYSTVGLKEKLIANETMWQCTYCNECSDTCPRDANPGEFVQALRKWSVAQYDPTGISSLIQTNNFFLLLFLAFTGLLVVLWAMVFGNLSNLPTERTGSLKLFENGLVDKLAVEIAGVIYMGFIGLFVAFQLFNMFRYFGKKHDDNFIHGLKNAWKTRHSNNENTYYHLLFSPILILKEIVFSFPMKSYNQMSKSTCQEKESKPWYPHLMIVLGFFGLLTATGIDFIFKHDANEWIPLWAPQRALGIVSGFLFLGGLSIIMYFRLRKSPSYYAKTTFGDWVLLILLWLVGFTGMLLTATLYINEIPLWVAYAVFLIHMIVVIQVFTYGAFGKFSHIWLRPFSILLINSLERRKKKIESTV
jgi:ferredoxin